MKTKKRPLLAARRTAYIWAIAAFVVLWWVVGQLLEWNWLPFLTADFDYVVPWIRFSLAVGIALNVVYLVRDPRWLAAMGEAIISAVNAVVAIVLLWEFPFDFSAYDYDWDRVARIVLIVAIVAGWVGAIVHLVRAILLLVAPPEEAPTS
jgi:hypothetical protein